MSTIHRSLANTKAACCINDECPLKNFEIKYFASGCDVVAVYHFVSGIASITIASDNFTDRIYGCDLSGRSTITRVSNSRSKIVLRSVL